jgi:endonuclease YncB( thermonuclease family)
MLFSPIGFKGFMGSFEGEIMGLVARFSVFCFICSLMVGSQAMALASISDPSAPGPTVVIDGKQRGIRVVDGDTFKIMNVSGKLDSARIFGINTLESYGPVHSLKGFSNDELLKLAHEATVLATKGTWHCVSKGKKDKYKRLLLQCDDLALAQLEAGLAHVMRVDTDEPNHAYLKAQQAAQRARKGLWAHGVPDFILTSLHSADESEGGGPTYDRLVSTLDGHTLAWLHNKNYRQCETVCHKPFALRTGDVERLSLILRLDVSLADVLDHKSNEELDRLLILLISMEDRLVSVDDPVALRIAQRIASYVDMGFFDPSVMFASSCMVYVRYDKRFALPRPECLLPTASIHGAI